MSEVSNEPKTHVFRKPCGCLSCVIYNVAKAQRYAAKHGESYEFMETKKLRKMAWACPEHLK